jgi:hypothetical protein
VPGTLRLSTVLLLGSAAALSLFPRAAVGAIHAESGQTDNATAEAKVLKFSVVSIRQNKSGGPQVLGGQRPKDTKCVTCSWPQQF